MKILALSDKVVPYIYSPEIRERYDFVEMVVGCGDLPAWYLEFVVSMLNVPLIYVPGNHDLDGFRVPGGRSIDGQLVEVEGIRILGLGGSRRYKATGEHQYTEAEMTWKLAPHLGGLIWRRLRSGRGCDLLITHAPPFGVHDAADRAHIGFRAFRTLVRTLRPALMLHGHSHVLRNLVETRTRLNGTWVINVYPERIIEWPPVPSGASA